MSSPTRYLAEEIRVQMARERISVADLARSTGLPYETLRRRVHGVEAITIDDLIIIADALELDAPALLGAALLRRAAS